MTNTPGETKEKSFDQYLVEEINRQDDFIKKTDEVLEKLSGNNRETREWEKDYSKIMLAWIESQWKLEEAHQKGNPYTRMKFEAESANLEHQLKVFIKKIEDSAVERTTEQLRVAFMDLQGEYGAEEEYAEKEWKHLLNHRRIELPINPPGDEKENI